MSFLFSHDEHIENARTTKTGRKIKLPEKLRYDTPIVNTSKSMVKDILPVKETNDEVSTAFINMPSVLENSEYVYTFLGRPIRLCL